MGVKTKTRVMLDEMPPGKAIARKARRMQITVSDKTWGRLVSQAEDIGVSIPAYATMILAQMAMQTEMARAAMPDMFKGVGEEVGRQVADRQTDE